MRAAGECQQHERAGKIEASVTFHARDNASSFFNEASTLTLWDFVKDNDLYVFLTSATYRAIRRRHASQKRATEYLLASGHHLH